MQMAQQVIAVRTPEKLYVPFVQLSCSSTIITCSSKLHRFEPWSSVQMNRRHLSAIGYSTRAIRSTADSARRLIEPNGVSWSLVTSFVDPAQENLPAYGPVARPSMNTNRSRPAIGPDGLSDN